MKTALRDVASFIRGVTFKPGDVEEPSEMNIDCMRTKNVQVELDQGDVWSVPRIIVKREEQFLRKGDVLVSSANSWNLVGKACWIPTLERPTTFGGFVSVLRPDQERVDARYLYRWFSSDVVQKTLRSFGNQTTNISNLDLKRASSLGFPQRPLDEQRRIAAILDMADELRAKRRRALTHLDVLNQSLYNDLQASTAHETVPLSEILKVSSGKFLPAKNMAKNGIHPVYGGNGVNGYHDNYLINEPTIVIGRVGAYCGAVHLAPAKSWVTDNALLVRIVRRDLDIKFLTAALDAANLNQFASQSGQPLISGSRIYPVEIPVPPLELQQTFATRVAAVERLKESHRKHLAELDSLFASLQHRAFQGAL